MTDAIELLIQARFDAVANPSGNGDWADVLARARRAEPEARALRVPIRLALAVAVAAVAATVTAVAFGWPETIVDFLKAPPAPQSAKAFFRAHNAAIPGGVSPQTKVGRAREIMTATFDANHIPPTNPTLHELYVAPAEGGGFCYLWTNFGGGCADAENSADATTNPAARPFGIEWLGDDYAGFVDGWVRPDATTVEARFADGTSASIPVTWVSSPIDAGFFAYVVPAAHLTRDDAVTSVVALDSKGQTIGEDPIPVTSRLDESVVQTLPNGTKVSLPRRAQAAHAREIVNGRANGAHVYLWVMPRIGGGVCFLFGTGAGGGGGCPSPRSLAQLPAVDGGVLGGSFYFAEVRPDVATVEFRYRNRSSERVTPIDGFVLHKLASRPTSAVGLDRHGKTIYTERLRVP